MDLRTFILGGDATFTVTKRSDGKRYTYRVTRTDNDAARYFVSVLTGPDNAHDYTYAGMLGDRAGNLQLRQTNGSKIGPTAPSWLGLIWLVSRIDRPEVLDRFVEVHHEGRCGRCRRKLTTPESIESGFGPECIKHV